MYRFVDVRGAAIGCGFAFWNTITDTFFEASGTQAWSTVEEFIRDVEDDPNAFVDISRAVALCPRWAFEEPQNEMEYY